MAQTSFYTDLLRRGISDYDQGQFARATRELRIASFGLLDDIPTYEKAQIYLTLALFKTNQLADARAAAQKIISAERVTPSYRELALDAALRREFEERLPKLVTPEDLASVPSLATIVVRSAKNWKEITDLYSEIRTRRRLTNDEMATLFVALVESGRVADAAALRSLLPPSVSASPSVAAQIAKVPAPPPIVQPSMASASGGLSPADITTQLRDASKAISEARFTAARQIYLRLAQQLTTRRDLNLEIARGLHRTSALRESSAVYQRLYPLRSGEEIHMLAEAINRYEIGDGPAARTLLDRAIPTLTASAELSLYRPRIERGL